LSRGGGVGAPDSAVVGIRWTADRRWADKRWVAPIIVRREYTQSRCLIITIPDLHPRLATADARKRPLAGPPRRRQEARSPGPRAAVSLLHPARCVTMPLAKEAHPAEHRDFP
jgi:hypothetical protein